MVARRGPRSREHVRCHLLVATLGAAATVRARWGAARHRDLPENCSTGMHACTHDREGGTRSEQQIR